MRFPRQQLVPGLPRCIGLMGVCLLLTGGLLGEERGRGYGRADVWYAGELVKAPPNPSDQPRNQPESPQGKSDSPNKLFAMRMLGSARELADMGDMQQARRLCQWASELHAHWELDEQSPSEVLRELESRYALSRQNQLRPTPPLVAPSPFRRTPAIETEQPEYGSETQPETEPNLTESVGVQGNTRLTVPDQPDFEPPTSDSFEAKTVGLPSDLSERSDLKGSASQVPAPGERLVPPPATPPATPVQFAEPPLGALPSGFSASQGPVLGFLLGVLVCVLLLVASVVLLRRLAAGGGALLRIELVNQGPHGLVVAATAHDQHGAFASRAGVGDQRAADATQTSDGVAVYAEDMDIPLSLDTGEPTFDEMQRREQEQSKEQELAILKNILEENVQLHEQILEADGVLT